MSWVTINGVHVDIGADGTIQAGPKQMIGSRIAADAEHFHGTSESSVASILKHGIRATDSSTGVKSAYVSTGKDLAFSYGAGAAARDGDKNVAIVVIKSGKQAGLFNPKGATNVAYYPGTIKPENIDRVEIYSSTAKKGEKPLKVIRPKHFAEGTLNGQWIELFRAGDYGDKGSYGVSDIDKMIANYDPAKHEAPAVIGHPEHNAPAFGWVESLKRVGNVLMGKLRQVQPAFEEMVRQGLFKKRSISFYATPNGPSLRHVGFLGAMPPEVKGLVDVKLADFTSNTEEFRTIDYQEESMEPEQISKSITQSLKEFFAEFFKGKKVTELNEVDQAKAIETAVAAAMKPMQDGYTALQKQFDDQKKELDKAKTTASTSAQAAFAEKQIARVKNAKRWIPAFDKMGLPQLFSELAKSETKITFGEGDKKTEKPAAEGLADFIIGLGEIVPMGEIANRQSQKRGNLVQFTEPKGDTIVDQQSIALAETAKKLAAEKKISYGEALTQVRHSGEFTDAGAAAAGEV